MSSAATQTTSFLTRDQADSSPFDRNRNKGESKNNDHKRAQRVQISFYAQNLKNCSGTFRGVSDPFAVVTKLARSPQEDHKVLGRTETIKNSLNPVWTKTFEIDYEFGRATYLNVGIYDENRRKNRDKPMGSCMFEVGDILGSRGNLKAKHIRNTGGLLYARLETILNDDVSLKEDVELELAGVNLHNVQGGIFGSDPFFEISKMWQGPGGLMWTVLYRSEYVKNNLNPKWKPFQISLDSLRSKDIPGESYSLESAKETQLLISVFDHNMSGRHKHIGKLVTSIKDLLELNRNETKSRKKELNLCRDDSKKHFGKLKIVKIRICPKTLHPQEHHEIIGAPIPPPPNSSPQSAYRDPTSTISPTSKSAKFPWPSSVSAPSRCYEQYPGNLQQWDSTRRPLFVDYISGGCELNMCVAIDFTGSNGDPKKPGTLHYINPDRSVLNEYETAMTTVGRFIAKYDSDQKFPVWGFGARLDGFSQVNQCFQIGPTEAFGLRGILDAYRGFFTRRFAMSGPTDFCDVIRCASIQANHALARASREGRQAYTVLLILTDGCVTDVEKNRLALIEASQSPLSILIVGLGDADFRNMKFIEELDPPSPARRIAHFVEFRLHRDRGSLAQESLEEIPVQLVDYFVNRGIMPQPHKNGSNQLVITDSFDERTDIDLNMDFKDDEIKIGINRNFDYLYQDILPILPQHNNKKPSAIDAYNTSFYHDPPPPPPHPQFDITPPANTNHHRSASLPFQNPRHVFFSQPGAGSSLRSLNLSPNYISRNYIHKNVKPTNLVDIPSSLDFPLTQSQLRPDDSPHTAINLSVNMDNTTTVHHTVASRESRPFCVRVAEGMTPGTNVEVTNPHTNQTIVVTIPPGVFPGSLFEVRC